MLAVATMPYMAKPADKQPSPSVPISFRLSRSEAEHLDACALMQSVPVDRAVLVAFIVRKYLAEHPAKPTPRPRRE